VVSGFPANDLVTFLLGPNAVTRSLKQHGFPKILAVWNAGFMVRDLLHNEYGLPIRVNRVLTNGARDHSFVSYEPYGVGKTEPSPVNCAKLRGLHRQDNLTGCRPHVNGHPTMTTDYRGEVC
jgi:hypothetical protein